jgi:hypothetical protein
MDYWMVDTSQDQLDRGYQLPWTVPSNQTSNISNNNNDNSNNDDSQVYITGYVHQVKEEVTEQVNQY